MTTTCDVTSEIRRRIDGLDWSELRSQLDARGHAMTTPALLTPGECDELSALFEDGRFRSTIEMGRHRFGEGRYRYFEHPLPETVVALRSSFYRHLAPIANDWSALLRGDAQSFPLEHEELLGRCRAAGRSRPTPLILRYREGDWNALHQDFYGEVIFPTSARPQRGKSGYHRVGLRHGLATVTGGQRTALGVIFHDGK